MSGSYVRASIKDSAAFYGIKKARRAAKLCFHEVDPFSHFGKCIGNPIVKKMAPRNINFLFFEPPDASIFTKIGSDLPHIRFYACE